MIDYPQLKEFPDCFIIKELLNKVTREMFIDFDYFGLLNQLRKTVSMEISYINQLFPEYTPHNNEYHLKNLFRIADQVLGEDLIVKMNVIELFVLICGLYGHDWGMAVSEIEKDYIINRKLKDIRADEELCFLKDEEERFNLFLEDNFIKDKNVSLELWRKYVRETHAIRSGERIKKFYGKDNTGISEAVRKVCIGHWLEFNEIRDYKLYPKDFSVLNHTINLRAIAIYIRLIDLLDITEERTPYIIWKFVSPKDPFSKMEWEKHRAIHSVACTDYQLGRIIKIDGSTDSTEVFAALEDLKVFCDEQFRGCNDLLAEMNDSYHKLNIYHIEWNIIANNFKPLSVRFEFNRERMFEILGEEIYHNDFYVFLRELLQNSIDAINLRKELLKRNGIPLGDFGEISINTEVKDNGEYIIEWKDNGIGMNQYIIKNYLAIAGKSYYNSEDLKKEGLNIDPISKFGIGILSCSTVSNHIEIETFRDPYIDSNSKPLKIRIPSFNNYFHIEEYNKRIDVGTKIKVFIDQDILNKKYNQKTLDVTSYLCHIAGFVEFPIIINECNKKTIILHPYHDGKSIKNKFGNEYKIQQLDFSYSIDNIFRPQDIPNISKYLEEKKLYIDKDLGCDNYEGVLSYFLPAKEEYDFVSHRGEYLLMHESMKQNKIEIRTKSYSTQFTYICPSCICNYSYSVYRDGILIPNVEDPFYDEERYNDFISPRIIVNLPKQQSNKIDLARTTLLEGKKWYDYILNKFFIYQINNLINRIKFISIDNIILDIARTFAYHSIPIKEYIKKVNSEFWYFPIIEIDGKITIEKWSNITSQEKIYFSPHLFGKLVGMLLMNTLYKKKINEIWDQWWCDKKVVASHYMGFYTPVTIDFISKINNFIIKENYHLESIRLLYPPLDSLPLLIQEVWEKNNDKKYDNEKDLIRKIADRNIEITPYDVSQLYEIISTKPDLLQLQIIDYKLPMICNFDEPFNKYFAYGFTALNLKNPITRIYLSVIGKIAYSLSYNETSLDKVGQIIDRIDDFPFYDDQEPVEFEIFIEKWKRLWDSVVENKLLDVTDISSLIPDYEDFVKGSVYHVNELFSYVDSDTIQDKILSAEHIHKFGNPVINL